jgi:hypothetical protein
MEKLDISPLVTTWLPFAQWRVATVIFRDFLNPMRVSGRNLWAMDHRAYDQGLHQRVPEDRAVSEGDWPNASL